MKLHIYKLIWCVCGVLLHQLSLINKFEYCQVHLAHKKMNPWKGCTCIWKHAFARSHMCFFFLGKTNFSNVSSWFIHMCSVHAWLFHTIWYKCSCPLMLAAYYLMLALECLAVSTRNYCSFWSQWGVLPQASKHYCAFQRLTAWFANRLSFCVNLWLCRRSLLWRKSCYLVEKLSVNNCYFLTYTKKYE